MVDIGCDSKYVNVVFYCVGGLCRSGERVDGEGVGVGTGAVARAKVGPFRSRASRSDTAPAEGAQNSACF